MDEYIVCQVPAFTGDQEISTTFVLPRPKSKAGLCVQLGLDSIHFAVDFLVEVFEAVKEALDHVLGQIPLRKGQILTQQN